VELEAEKTRTLGPEAIRMSCSRWFYDDLGGAGLLGLSLGGFFQRARQDDAHTEALVFVGRHPVAARVVIERCAKPRNFPAQPLDRPVNIAAGSQLNLSGYRGVVRETGAHSADVTLREPVSIPSLR